MSQLTGVFPLQLEFLRDAYANVSLTAKVR